MASDTPTTKTEYAHVACTPGVLGGKPCVAGHRIRICDIAAARDLKGFSPEEIAATLYPDLTLAQVYAALAYYEDHRDAIDGSLEDEPRFADNFARRHPQLVRDVRPERG
ncbi:MAG: DUF433 domain-containing protein [Candidatus Nealsonbacteria bacterium]|nr:DUF433 domain-containing protein [Candidatus Nealsonbacteria bacterium]